MAGSDNTPVHLAQGVVQSREFGIRFLKLDTTQAAAYFALMGQVAQKIVVEEMQAGLIEGGALYAREAKDAAPTGVTSLFRASIAFEDRSTDQVAVVNVYSPLNYAAPLENGTKPHWVPIEPLIDWVHAKLDISDEKEALSKAYAIRGKIAKKGTAAKKVFAGAFDRIEPQLTEMLGRSVQRLSARVAAGKG